MSKLIQFSNQAYLIVSWVELLVVLAVNVVVWIIADCCDSITPDGDHDAVVGGVSVSLLVVLIFSLLNCILQAHEFFFVNESKLSFHF